MARVVLLVRVRAALAAAAVVGGLVCLALRVLLALHSSILEPYLDLSLGQVQVPRQFPPSIPTISTQLKLVRM